MDRVTMLDKAKQLAHEKVDSASAINEKYYEELNAMPDERAIVKLAEEFLNDAADDIRGGF